MIDGCCVAIDDETMDRILRITRSALCAVKGFYIRFVVREEKLAIRIAIQVARSKFVGEWKIGDVVGSRVIGLDADMPWSAVAARDDRLALTCVAPCPCVAKPQ